MISIRLFTFCHIPSYIGLDYFWLTYPVTDGLTTVAGFLMCLFFFKKAHTQSSLEKAKAEHPMAIMPSLPGVIITIAREHGSGGKQIGKMVAERLGIPFYYKEMTALAAEESGLDREFISGLNKNSPRRLHDLYLSRKVVRHAIRAQYKVIQKIADSGSCVIVGRAADFVLRDRSDVVRVFIHAPEEYRIKRVMERYGDSKKEAEKNIKHSDKARAPYYKHISGLEWSDDTHYDMVIDSSVGLDAATELILAQLQSASVLNS